MSNHIKKLLRIVDKNIVLSDVEEIKKNNNKMVMIYGKLSYSPTGCPNCGSSQKDAEGRHIIVKNGSKSSLIRLENYQHLPTILNFSKQRFHCKNCKKHWTSESNLTQRHCFIAAHVKIKILDLLTEKISMTLIAKLCQVSIQTVIRVLRSVETNFLTLQNQFLYQRF
ncbi:transposase family protein [Vagococcus sp.]|uniref:transposase family protein n=1 Tax=Vagococcus sp. TaxID=1933889 RepID=UPI003F982E10